MLCLFFCYKKFNLRQKTQSTVYVYLIFKNFNLHIKNTSDKRQFKNDAKNFNCYNKKDLNKKTEK